MADPNAMHHGHTRREYNTVPMGTTFVPGRFGRMFPELPPLAADLESLKAMAEKMLDENDELSNDNPTVPAGYTYLGQFVDHDITFDPTTIPEVQVDPQAVHNFRTPKLELDSIYGTGPDLQPYMYGRTPEDAAKLVFGATVTGLGDPGVPAGMPNDLPRLNKVAVIGDPRNDENLAVAQTHIAFMKLHNRFVDVIRNEPGGADLPRKELFEAARQRTVWHYQRMLLDDFLRRLIMPEVLDDVLANGRRYYHFDLDAYMPVEFSVAAYRLGHSMVRNTYDFNRVFRTGGVTPATLELLFQFSNVSGEVAPIPSDWIIDWRRWYEFTEHAGAKEEDGSPVAVNHSRALDPFLARALHDLPRTGGVSLPFANLRRGVAMGLPSGQDVAARMGLTPLSPEDVGSGPDGQQAAFLGFHTRTPLWLYILKEAKVQQKGERLGEVGSRILAEVFVGLLEGDPTSFLVRDRHWRPTIPLADKTRVTMPDLLRFIGELNPIGEKRLAAPAAPPQPAPAPAPVA